MVFNLTMAKYGPVNLSVYQIVVHFCKQIKPVFDMVKAAPRRPAGKAVVKAFCPALDVLHSPLDNAFLKRGMYMVFKFQEPAGLRIRCPAIR